MRLTHAEAREPKTPAVENAEVAANTRVVVVSDMEVLQRGF